MPSADTLGMVLIALLIDAVIGDPDCVWRRWPHPVSWIGALIGELDARLNRDQDPAWRRRIAGIGALALLLAVAGGTGWLIERLVSPLPFGWLIVGMIGSVLIAQQSLYRHVAGVREGFATGGLAGARRAVAMIVGRDLESLDQAAICRAAIESCAENFSDGVVAPVFWFALGGLPGLMAYKAINTADSMIGHRSMRHAAFGWAAARVDDLVNLIPARLAGLLIALAMPLAGGGIDAALRIMVRDARLHRSPNAGWPESAMAGGLGLALAGPRRYGALVVDDLFLNSEGRVEAVPADITRALRVLAGACALQFLVVAALWAALV